MPIAYLNRRIGALDEVQVSGRRVLVRIDINSPVDPSNGSVLDESKIKSHVETIRELAEGGASVVLMSHQGTPAGDDFIRLERHAEILSRHLGLPVGYVPDVIGPEAVRRINALGRGEVLLLDNTRILSEDYVEAPPEVHARGIMVSTLSKHFNYYVNDAFAAAHRSQASIVGFPLVLPSVAGRHMEGEVTALSHITSGEEKPKVYVLGGAKLKDTVNVVKHAIERGAVDEVLTTGLVALLFLYASGVNVGEAERVVKSKADEKTIEQARRLISSGAPVMVPLDFYSEVDGGVELVEASRIRGTPKDVGPSTINCYSGRMRGARVIVMRGPAGVIEDPRFKEGTRRLVEAALASGAYTVFGGGHFNAVLSELPGELRGRVGHISTGGGALLYFLANSTLPALEALAKSYEKFFGGGGR